MSDLLLLKSNLISETENLLNNKRINDYKELLIYSEEHDLEIDFLNHMESVFFVFEEIDFLKKQSRNLYFGSYMLYVEKNQRWFANQIFSVYKKLDGRLKKISGSLYTQFNCVDMQKLAGTVILNMENEYIEIELDVSIVILEQNIDQIVLRFNPGLKIYNVAYAGQKLKFEYLDLCNNGVVIYFDAELEVGKSIVLHVRYGGNPILREPCFMRKDSAVIWGETMIFPVISFFPRDKYQIDIEYCFDKTYSLVSVGNFVSEYIDKGRKYSHWTSEEPVMGMAISINDYQQKLFTHEDIVIRAYYDNKEETIICDTVKKIFMCIFYYKELFHFIPYKEINVCFDITFTICCVNSNFISLYRLDDVAISHELAHLWWGVCVTGNGLGWKWIHEYFADFFSELYLENYKIKPIDPFVEKDREFIFEKQDVLMFNSIYGKEEGRYNDYNQMIDLKIKKIGKKCFLQKVRKILLNYKFKSITVEELMNSL